MKDNVSFRKITLILQISFGHLMKENNPLALQQSLFQQMLPLFLV